MLSSFRRYVPKETFEEKLFADQILYFADQMVNLKPRNINNSSAAELFNAYLDKTYSMSDAAASFSIS